MNARVAQGNGCFGWRQAGLGRVLVCEPLLEVATHVFTTRQLATPADANPDVVADLLSISHQNVREARQVHGKDIFVAGKPDGSRLRPDADILLTATPGLGLVVRVADCVPILLADRRTGVVGAVHAGWRGTCAAAAMAAVRGMAHHFGSRPADLVAAVGPSIGPCCYEVGEDVRAAFMDAQASLPPVADWFLLDGSRWRLDLWAATFGQLVAAGLDPGSIHLAYECTASALDRYYSFRREGGRAGRLFAAIRTGLQGSCPGR
jgi:YfiH family protein